MSSRTSLEIPGLPDLPCRHFQVQNKRNPLRCQAMTVSGLTMMRAERNWGQKRKNQTQRNRSQGRSFGRLTERFKTMIWCRRAMISVWSARRDRKPASRTENSEIRMLSMNRRLSARLHKFNVYSPDGVFSRDSGGMMGHGWIGGFSWIWIPTLLTLGLGVLLGWLIFGKK